MSRPERLQFLSDLMLLAVAVVWGTSYGVAKSALEYYPVLGLLALRFGITFVVLSPALRPLRHADARGLRGVLGAGVLLFSIFLCETFGLLLTRAANAAFLISLCVVLTPLVEWSLLKRRPSRIEWMAVGLSLLGAWLLAGDGAFTLSPGDALILAAAVLRAVTVCVTKRVMRDAALPPLTVTAVQSGVVRQCGGSAGICARSVAARTVFCRAPDVLGLRVLSGARLHAVRVLRAELCDQTQQPNARGAADGQ
jgi:drug/metabolite transporter (DMT)-like permease